MNWDAAEISALIHAALDEDIGAGDITCAAIVPAKTAARAKLIAKQELVLAGLPLAERVFRALDASVRWDAKETDGAAVSSGALMVSIDGAAGGS